MMTSFIMTSAPFDETLAVQIPTLNFSYGGPPILQDINLQLPRGARCLLVGANGTGKTTLLRILAGKRMVKDEVRVLGKNAFVDAPLGVTYLGTEWAANPVVRSDLRVDYLLQSMGGHRWPERRDELLDVLDVNINWRMHQVSDGERRRVQLVMGLMQPWDLLLLDEVTVDLDVLVRSDFLEHLKKETEERGATIVCVPFVSHKLTIWRIFLLYELPIRDQVYATHIFDGHMTQGTIVSLNSLHSFPELELFKQYNREHGIFDSPLVALCLSWLRQDRDRERKRKRGDLEAPLESTGKAITRWDELSEDMKKYGDRYYNYWKT
ncbi:hypothetical protein BC938DRAFT_471637 [Jimgerdemannia flammicorona]|uniref:ABC transporter domain-containing protein n=1 Tax=Jimgerdemannia flammicorona TaxID=994334 RepID=A0A433R008_9FUNG|nr:hypothetical protein BC938DRAFT_471637 [Jimgerdemannia flammicorona]